MALNANLLTDLSLELLHNELRPVYAVQSSRMLGPGGKGLMVDFGSVTGRDNLAQAIIIRLLTPRGELAALGHPQFGSRLHELIGSVNTETKRNLVRLYILESLQMEPRIEKIQAVTVQPAVKRPTSVDVSLRVLPVGDTQTVSIGPITLEL